MTCEQFILNAISKGVEVRFLNDHEPNTMRVNMRKDDYRLDYRIFIPEMEYATVWGKINYIMETKWLSESH